MTTILPVHYVDQFGVSRTIVGTDFEAPFLHLVLNLRAGSALLSPTVKRFPLNRTQKTAVLAANAKTRVAMIPIFGRKNVRVQAVSTATSQICTFWVGLVRNVNESAISGAGSSSPVWEVPAGTSAAVPASNIATDFTITNPCADYVTLYCTTAADTTIVWTVTAED